MNMNNGDGIKGDINMRPIKQDALLNDQRIIEMSIYQETHGNTRSGTFEGISKRIKEFKTMIKRKETTLDELEDLVFSRYGILNDNSIKDTDLLDNIKKDPYGFFSDLFKAEQGLSVKGKDVKKEKDEKNDIDPNLNPFFDDILNNDFPPLDKNEDDKWNDSDDIDGIDEWDDNKGKRKK
jgi:hypothetical protein